MQQSLFEAREGRRIALDEESWVDYTPAWAPRPDALFEHLLATRRWAQRTRWLWEKKMLEPRLTDRWVKGEPLEPQLCELLEKLNAAYSVDFDSIGFNYYRDGSDSVAPHGDKIHKRLAEPIVALVSLGATRRFLLKPRAGGKSCAFDLGSGDLLVTGGKTQRTWLHSIPKVVHAGARISLAFRYGLDPNAYGGSALRGSGTEAGT